MPIARFLSSASMALMVTTGLLYLMQLLIDFGPDVIVERQPPALIDWIGKTPEEHTLIDPLKPDRLPDPVQLPSDPRRPDPGNNSDVGIPVHPPAPRPGGPAFERPGITDGALMNIIKVAPTYPVRAIINGIEGHVTVRYDVMANGTVANVVIIESSNRVFNDAAMEAAYRFRYKPRIVDGIAIETRGLQNLFTFRLDD